MPVNPFNIIYCLISVGYIFQSTGVYAAITVTPNNTAVVSGTSTTLHCNSSLGSTGISWTFQSSINFVYLCGTPSLTGYSVNSTVPGQCDLIITSATATFAGIYSCGDAALQNAAYLTVLTSNPTMTSNLTSGYVAENDVVIMTCSVSYTAQGGMEAYMTWSGSGCTESAYINSTTDATSSATVVAKPPTLSSCTCTTQITAPTSPPGGISVGNNPASNTPSYSSSISSASGYNVSYCPFNIEISPAGGNVSQYRIFTCTSQAYPPAGYHWTIVTSNGTTSATGQTFELTSVGDYNITCYATNYLYGTSNPCTNSTSVNGSSYPSAPPTTEVPNNSTTTQNPCPTPCIALSVVLGCVGLAGLCVLITACCCCKNCPWNRCNKCEQCRCVCTLFRCNGVGCWWCVRTEGGDSICLCFKCERTEELLIVCQPDHKENKTKSTNKDAAKGKTESTKPATKDKPVKPAVHSPNEQEMHQVNPPPVVLQEGSLPYNGAATGYVNPGVEHGDVIIYADLSNTAGNRAPLVEKTATKENEYGLIRSA